MGAMGDLMRSVQQVFGLVAKLLEKMALVNCKITGYSVYQNGKKVGTTTWNNLGVDNLTASTKYSFAVTAADTFGSSAKSKAHEGKAGR